MKDSWLSSQKVMPVLWLEAETKLWLGPGGKDLVQALVKGDSLNLCPTDSVLKEKQIPASVVMGWNSEQEDEEETLLLLSCSNCRSSVLPNRHRGIMDRVSLANNFCPVEEAFPSIPGLEFGASWSGSK